MILKNLFFKVYTKLVLCIHLNLRHLKHTIIVHVKTSQNPDCFHQLFKKVGILCILYLITWKLKCFKHFTMIILNIMAYSYRLKKIIFHFSVSVINKIKMGKASNISL